MNDINKMCFASFEMFSGAGSLGYAHAKKKIEVMAMCRYGS